MLRLILLFLFNDINANQNIYIIVTHRQIQKEQTNNQAKQKLKKIT